jgi:methylglutaconyl-CoA hydratase
MTEGYVRTEIEQGVATVEFFHPSSNSLPGQILNDLAKAINDAGEDVRVNVIVLRSAGTGAFCAGASFDELVAIKSEAEGKQFFSGFANVINAMRKCHKFIIGRVQGKAVGGGVGLASAVDYCIATENASIKLSELAIGIGPFVVGPAVQRKVGLSAFTALTIDAANWRSAEWAKRKGLYAEMHATVEEVDDAVKRISTRLAKYNPTAMQELKKNFWAGTENWDTLLSERAAMSGKLVLSEFTRNAINAFKAKA